MSKSFDELTTVDWLRIWERARRKEVSRGEYLAQKLKPHLADHDCFEGGKVDGKLFTETKLGGCDDWELSMWQCQTCKWSYLHAFLEDNGMPRSARWFMGKLAPDALPRDFKPDAGLRILAQFDRLFYGGSYWGHCGKWSEHVANFRDLSKFRVMEHTE